jgi:hypothetical protein
MQKNIHVPFSVCCVQNHNHDQNNVTVKKKQKVVKSHNYEMKGTEDTEHNFILRSAGPARCSHQEFSTHSHRTA